MNPQQNAAEDQKCECGFERTSHEIYLLITLTCCGILDYARKSISKLMDSKFQGVGVACEEGMDVSVERTSTASLIQASC